MKQTTKIKIKHRKTEKTELFSDWWMKSAFTPSRVIHRALANISTHFCFVFYLNFAN